MGRLGLLLAALACLVMPTKALAGYGYGWRGGVSILPTSLCPKGLGYFNSLGQSDNCLLAHAGADFQIPTFFNGGTSGTALAQQSGLGAGQAWFQNNGYAWNVWGVDAPVGYYGTMTAFPAATSLPGWPSQCSSYVYPLLTCANWPVGTTVTMPLGIDFHDTAHPIVSFPGSIVGTSLTSGTQTQGGAPEGAPLAIGQQIYGVAVLPHTIITGGSAPNWTVNNSQMVGPESLAVYADVSLLLAANVSGPFKMYDFEANPAANAKALGYFVKCNGCGTPLQDYEDFDVDDSALLNFTPPTQSSQQLTQDFLDGDSGHTIIMRRFHAKPSGRLVSGSAHPAILVREDYVIEGLALGSGFCFAGSGCTSVHGEIDQYSGNNSNITSETYSFGTYYQPNTPTEVTAQIYFDTGQANNLSIGTATVSNLVAIGNICNPIYNYDQFTCANTGRNVGLVVATIGAASVGTLNLVNIYADYTGSSNTGHGCIGSGSRAGVVTAFIDDGLGAGTYDGTPGNVLTVTAMSNATSGNGFQSGMSAFVAGMAGGVVVTSSGCGATGCHLSAATGPYTVSGPAQAVPSQGGWVFYPTITTLNASGNFKLIGGGALTVTNGPNLADNCN